MQAGFFFMCGALAFYRPARGDFVMAHDIYAAMVRLDFNPAIAVTFYRFNRSVSFLSEGKIGAPLFALIGK